MNIDWNQRRYIGAGCNGVVYEIDNKAYKVGIVPAIEVARQLYFAQKELAVPIYAYREQCVIPEYIAKEVCIVHGYREDYFKTYQCSCEIHTWAILCMELARPCTIHTPEIEALTNSIKEECMRVFGFGRDTRHVNMGYYKETLIALDFGY